MKDGKLRWINKNNNFFRNGLAIECGKLFGNIIQIKFMESKLNSIHINKFKLKNFSNLKLIK